jgi:hypothetical protein
MPPVNTTDQAQENRSYVRARLSQAQPEFAAVLGVVEQQLACPVYGGTTARRHDGQPPAAESSPFYLAARASCERPAGEALCERPAGEPLWDAINEAVRQRRPADRPTGRGRASEPV